VKYVIAARDGIVSQTSARRANWDDRHEIVPGAGHADLVKPQDSSAPSFQIVKEFLLSKADISTRFARPNYAQPQLVLHNKLINKERNRFYFGAEAVEFMGREVELDALRVMLDPTLGVFNWAVLYGSGGVGKSRLAHELCKQLQGEWYAGFFLQRDIMQLNWRTWQPMMPTLLVIDYAARSFYEDNRDDRLAQMIGDIADRASGQGLPIALPVRVLLLERNGSGKWLQSILSKSRNTPDTKFNADLELKTTADPWDLIKFVVSSSGHPLPSRDEVVVALESLDRERRPLFAHLLADAILRNPGNWRALDAERLIADVIDRERRNIWEPSGARNEEEYALALAIMTKGLDIDKMAELSVTETLLPVWDQRRHPEIFGTMTGLSARERIPAWEPDIVGEYFVLQLLESKYLSSASRSNLCEMAWRVSPIDMIQFVVRAHHDAAEHSGLRLLRRPPASKESRRYWFTAVTVLFRELKSYSLEIVPDLVEDVVGCIFDIGFDTLAIVLFDPYFRSTYNELVERLWLAITALPKGLADSALDAPPGAVSYFLDGAQREGRHDFVVAFYGCLADNLPRLADRVVAAPLDQIGVLLEVALKHGQYDLVAKLHKSLASNVEQLTWNISKRSLDHVGPFLDRALKHEQHDLIAGVCESMANDPRRLADVVFKTSLDHLGAFLGRLRAHNQNKLILAIY
jgi:hypothetical protein